MRFQRVVWSPVEVEYLKANREKLTQDQLCIALSKSRGALKKKLDELDGKVTAKKTGVKFQSKIGRREDLKCFVRSGWEANVFRYFKFKGTPYKAAKYEPKIFSFADKVPPKGQALSYTPDFQVTNSSTGKKHWVEVKGNWLRGSDKTKLRRFKKFYPEDFKALIAVVSSKKTKTAKFFLDLGVPEDQIIEYNQLQKEYSKKIKHWE